MVGADDALWMASLSKLLARRVRLRRRNVRSRAHLYNIAALNPFLVVIDM
jgi:hypothetical protein